MGRRNWQRHKALLHWYCCFCRCSAALAFFTGWRSHWWSIPHGECSRRIFPQDMQKIRNISTTDIRWLWSGTDLKSIWHRENSTDFTNVRNADRKWECQKAEEKSASPVQNAGQNLWKKVENKRRFFHCLVISISIKKNYRKKVKKYIRHITADSARNSKQIAAQKGRCC